MDKLLQQIVAIAQKSSAGSEKRLITLQVGGVLVSGEIISAREFLEEDPLTEKMRKHLPGVASEDNDVVVDYIHLAKAEFFLPGAPMIQTEGPGIMWRGRISQVAGFFFGTLRMCPVKTERFGGEVSAAPKNDGANKLREFDNLQAAPPLQRPRGDA